MFFQIMGAWINVQLKIPVLRYMQRMVVWVLLFWSVNVDVYVFQYITGTYCHAFVKIRYMDQIMINVSYLMCMNLFERGVLKETNPLQYEVRLL